MKNKDLFDSEKTSTVVSLKKQLRFVTYENSFIDDTSKGSFKDWDANSNNVLIKGSFQQIIDYIS